MTMFEKKSAWSLPGVMSALILTGLVAGCGGVEATDPSEQEAMTASEQAPLSSESDMKGDDSETAAISPAVMGTCSAGKLCFYRNINFGPSKESHGEAAKYIKDLTKFSHPECGKPRSNWTWNDCISSLRNNTNRCWTLYSDVGYVGDTHRLGPHDSYPDLTKIKYNDVISSMNSYKGHCL